MTGLVTLLAIGFVTAVLLLALTMMHRLTHPPRKTYAWAVSRSRPGTPGELPSPRAFSAVEIAPLGTRLPAWDIPGDKPEGPLVIFTPGWGDSRLGVLPRLDALLPFASRVLAWDPSGQGDAAGTCDLGVREAELLTAIIADEARDAGVAARGVVLYGSSLGAGVSLVSASDPHAAPHARAVIAEGVYRLARTPAFNVMRLSALPYRLNGPLAFALLGLSRSGWRGFDRAEHAARLACPLLVLHGEADEVSPPEDARAVAAAARRVTLAMIPAGTHNELWTDESTRPACVAAVAEFLGMVAAGGGGSPWAWTDAGRAATLPTQPGA